MNQQNKSRIFNQLRNLALLKNKDVTDQVLELYTEILSRSFGLEESMSAIQYFMLNEKWFPDISEIIKKIQFPNGEDGEAREEVEKIFEAFFEFGYKRATKARESLGEDLWEVVEKRGGWLKFYNEINTTNNLSTIRAQLRELIKSKRRRKQEQKLLESGSKLIEGGAA